MQAACRVANEQVGNYNNNVIVLADKPCGVMLLS